MLDSLRLQNFTVFPDADFKFGKNLNIIVGENGAGKTHILKLAYSLLSVMARGVHTGSNPTKLHLRSALADTMRDVFRPDEIGHLVRLQAGRAGCDIEGNFGKEIGHLTFSLGRSNTSGVSVASLPVAWARQLPVYLPPRELLSIAPGFVSLYDNVHVPFEATWRDTIALLQVPLAKGAREGRIRNFLRPLERALEGTVETRSGDRFYLKTKTGTIEMHLVAEGLRKLAMVARLIAAGFLLGEGALFWDEPEANLNPKTIKTVARTIMEISYSGTQVFIATHSLYLLRELYILQKTDYTHLDTRCFGLHIGDDGAVTVQSGETIDDIGDITALDEELSQSDRYMETEEKLSASV